jgi:uncharacterized protein (DUF1330 family)
MALRAKRAALRFAAMSALEPTTEQIAAFAQLPEGEPVVMVNLLQFKADGGAESYGRYAAAVQEHLDRAGARVLYVGAGRQVVIGAEQEPWWDAIALVEYPSPQAFLAMVADPAYQAVHVHRADGLSRTELVATAGGQMPV